MKFIQFQMKLKYIIAVVLLNLFVSNSHASREIKISGSAYMFSLVEFSPTLKFTGTLCSHAEPKPEWLDCYIKSLNYSTLSFSEWQQLSTERYRALGGFTEAEFAEVSKLQTESPTKPVSTCFYYITVADNSTKFYLVVSIEKNTDELSDQESSYEIFRNVGGVILRDIVEQDNGWLNMFPILNLPKLRELANPEKNVVLREDGFLSAE